VASATPAPPPAATTAATASGVWKIQLGAFGVASNADALWNRVKSRPELAGHPRINARAGAVTKLQAGSFASQQAAQAACSRLAAAGFTCIATR
jgi:cell division septation protein DedD